MILCHHCAHWGGRPILPEDNQVVDPKNEWRFGECDLLRCTLEVDIRAGWDGGTVRTIETPASFGCVLGVAKSS